MYAFLGEVDTVSSGGERMHANALVLLSVATQLFDEKSVCTDGHYARSRTGRFFSY